MRNAQVTPRARQQEFIDFLKVGAIFTSSYLVMLLLTRMEPDALSMTATALGTYVALRNRAARKTTSS